MRLEVADRLQRRRAEASAVEPRLRRAAGVIVLALLLTAALQLAGHEPVLPILMLAAAGALGASLALTHVQSTSEARYRTLFERAPVGIARVSIGGRWLEVNQAYCDILGYTRRELLSLSLRDVTHPEDLASDAAEVTMLLSGQHRSIAVQKRYLRKGGGVLWVDLVLALVRSADEGSSYFVATVTDISARKEAELARDQARRAAEEARALLDALYVQAPIGLGYFDRELRSVFVNETLARMVGLSVDQHVGRLVNEIVPGARGADAEEDMRRVLETGTPTTGLLALSEPRGAPHQGRAYVVSYYPVRMSSAGVVGVGCIAEDVTERRRNESEREQLVAELREAVRARDDFLSIASHELRTPLTTLTLGAEHLIRLVDKGTAPEPAQLRARAERIHAQGRRLERLVGTLLDVARIAQGRVQLFPEELDVALVVRDQVERLRESAARSGSELTVEAPGPLLGRFDRTRLEQIVDNLVANAIKFGRGQPIRVALESSDEAIRLIVRDQGLGIAKEDRARVFERFERAVSERHYGGLGLGLWVTRQLVEAMGGSVFVTGELGQGSTFIVEWPRLS